MSKKILKIENEGLTGYYLGQKFENPGRHAESGFQKIIKGDEHSGLVFIQENEDEKETIELHYTDEKDLKNKVSYILMVLTDR